MIPEATSFNSSESILSNLARMEPQIVCVVCGVKQEMLLLLCKIPGLNSTCSPLVSKRLPETTLNMAYAREKIHIAFRIHDQSHTKSKTGIPVVPQTF